MNYKDYNDFELLYLVCEQNEEAYEILYNKYKPIVELKAKKYLKYAATKGLDYNDLIQEGMIGLSEAINDFKVQKDVKFSTFASLCIDRQISSAVLAANRKKHMVLNDSISLDDKVINNTKSLLEIIFDKKDSDPSEYIVSLETETETYNMIMKELTPFEKEVFDLKLKNFSYKEITEILGKSYKSIDSALQRIKGKLKKIIIEKE